MAFPEPVQLTELLTPMIKEHGFDLEDVKTAKAGKKSQVVVRVDGNQRPSSDDLESLSREIGDFFDGAEQRGELNFGAGYTLEVSTPGVDLPLTAPRHWRRNRGRVAKIETTEVPGKHELWRIGALDGNDEDSTAVVLVRTERKEIVAEIQRLEKIASAVVEIEFSQASAAELEVAHEDFDVIAGRID